ncbi:hypothetical protein CAL26_09985 [Bordetella genomosp. 9]|uniref:Ubiquitin-activating enzyme E1 FCCH domain-containing protein n=2 Tax=Bordetella genomosp. 9 TaxID=1416803 RepID=A0A261RGJ5_9BORD|nr:hypothetical protein CAL26_09985 [Bordetella genomosp. 9]
MDLANFQTGLALCRNFWTLPHGPAQNRPGTEFVAETKDSSKRSRLLRFAFNTEQTFAMEFGDQYVRFHTQGSTLLEAPKTITNVSNALPAVVTAPAHGYSQGDTVYITGIAGQVALNGRKFFIGNVTSNTFSLFQLNGNGMDTTGMPPYVAGGAALRVYEIGTPYLEADLEDLHYVQSGDVLTIVHPSYAPRELRRLGATSWTLSTIAFGPTLPGPTDLVANAFAGSGTANNQNFSYVVTAVAPNTLEESIASNVATCTNDLTLNGAHNDLTWTAVPGAVRHNVYKASDSNIFGYVGQTPGTDGFFRDDNIDEDVTKTPPENNDPFTSTGNYPSAVGYIQQRRVFAGTLNRPQTVWLTRTGTESNMSSSIPSRDDDAIVLRVAASQVNVMRHLVPLADMMMLTSDAEWRLTTAGTDVLTPTSVAVKPQSYTGSSNVQPVVANNRLIFSANRDGHLQEVVYNNDAGGYVPSDISILATHLLEDYSISDMAFMRAPVPIVWSVRADGTLLGTTYVPDQKVVGWHQHDTVGGFFESCTTINEGREESLYVIVRRTVQGRTVRYVERLHTRRFQQLADAFFVDCGLTYQGAPVGGVTGLHHLEGLTVAILADGAVMAPRVVTGGVVELEHSASTVHIGLPITADLQTLPFAVEQAQAFGAGRPKNINKVFARVRESSAIQAGPDFESLVEFKQRTNEPMGTPPRLISGEIEIPVRNNWSTDGQLCVRQARPLPVTVVSMCSEAAIGG